MQLSRHFLLQFGEKPADSQFQRSATKALEDGPKTKVLKSLQTECPSEQWILNIFKHVEIRNSPGPTESTSKPTSGLVQLCDGLCRYKGKEFHFIEALGPFWHSENEVTLWRS